MDTDGLENPKDSKVDLQVRLPPELLLVILHHLRFDRNALRQFCLATRQIKSRSPCSSLYETLCQSPHIVTHIRHVDIVSPRLGPTWNARESTLPLLLTLLADAEIVRTFRLRCSSESWGDLPLELQHSIQLLLKSPSLRNLDFSGVVRLTTDIFKYCRGQKRRVLESFTSLDMHVVDVVAWMIATPSFRTLRDLRIAVTHDEVNALQNLLRHVSGTLESLSLQLIIWYWPKGAPTCSISLPSLRSLRLSVGITKPCCDDDDIFHWAICFLLEQHRYKTLQHLTLALRFDDASDPHALKWSELDSALSDFMFSALKTLVVTLFPMYPEAEPVARLVGDELPRLLPWTAERDLFEILRLDRPTSSFFYWPGPLDWSETFADDPSVLCEKDAADDSHNSNIACGRIRRQRRAPVLLIQAKPELYAASAHGLTIYRTGGALPTSA
ncbi:hypothetical protein R3P38DRAFT_3463680 [Favolaschia claudopus]|uniref:F-box domain-containing protein n=1 Tax=Favolaschia claudopus TaxID=2862362 RepID=A0AAV9ZGZ3_9AGAR